MKKKFTISLRPHKNFFRMMIVFLGIGFAWSGLWGLIDTYFFPGNPLLSKLISLFLGIFILYLPDEDVKELI